VKVAYFSPLPPDQSGIADYSALLLSALARLIDVEAVRPGRTRPPGDADVAVYHVGNNPDAHGWIVDALRRRPGVVVLHDFVLHHLMAGLTIGRKDGHAYLAAMEREAGVPGRLLGYGVLEGRVPPLWEVRPEEFPLAGEVLDRATGLIVHSRYVEARVREAGYEGPLWVIPHPAWPAPAVEPARVEGSPLYGCFGHLNESKRIPQLLEAFARVRRERPEARLLLVGPSSPGFDLDGRIERLGLDREGVIREDYVEEERLWSLMAACDAIVALRAPTMGETSGTAIRALSAGKPLVVSDVGWFSELPDEVALKVPVGGDAEVDALAAALEQLAADASARTAMGEAARAYAEREHDLETVAARYAAALEESAGRATVEAKVLREIASAASEVGVEPELLAPRLAEAGLATDGRGPAAHVQRPGRWTWPARTPVWFWLGAIVLVSSIVQFLLGRRIVAPWIMVDELVYSDAARSFAETGRFLIRGMPANYGIVYPAILSIPYRLFDTVPAAYGAAKAINAPLISLAAIPAYFLARRVLRKPAALAAAALAVALPSLAYAGTLMTENAFYPLFLCFALALVAMLERPTARRQLLVLALCVLLFLTRAQAVALVAAALTAPLLLAWIERGRPRRLTVYAPLYGVTLLAGLAVVIAQVARGRSPLAALGNYSVTGSSGYGLWPSIRWLLYHLAELDLALWVLPFAALIVVASTARHLDRPLRVYAAAAVASSAWLTVEVAVFASRYSDRVEERNLFYVMPLFLIALLAWIERGQPRPPRATIAAAVVAAALPGMLPFQHLLGGVSSESDTIGLRPWWYVRNELVGADTVSLVVVLVSIALAAAFLWLPRRHAPWLPVLVVAGFLATWLPLQLWSYSFHEASVGALFQGIRTGDRDWIDTRVGRDSNVAALWTNHGDVFSNAFTIWENEFFNRSVRRVYDLGAPLPGAGAMPETNVSVDRATGEIRAAGRAVRADYVLTDESVELLGTVVARDRGRSMVLVKVREPLRLTTRVIGIYPDDTWSGPRVLWIRSSCRGGTLTARLRTDISPFPSGQTVLIRPGGGPPLRIRLTRRVQARTVRVPLRSVGGVCRATFLVSPTIVPRDVPKLQNSDPRLLGTNFDKLTFTPSR
jgi:glycosyltransferase involved in cell wall biosynthesis